MYNKEWMEAEKKVDPNFEGSIWEKLGHENRLCPTCEAHLYKGICLNACHLAPDTKKRFEESLHKFVSKENK